MSNIESAIEQMVADEVSNVVDEACQSAIDDMDIESMIVDKIEEALSKITERLDKLEEFWRRIE